MENSVGVPVVDEKYVTHFFVKDRTMNKFHGPYKTYEMAEEMAKEIGLNAYTIEKITKRKDFDVTTLHGSGFHS